MQMKIMAVPVSDTIRVRLSEALAKKPAVEAVAEIESLHPPQIRGFLDASRIQSKKLRELLEASLSRHGSMEKSPLVEALSSDQLENLLAQEPPLYPLDQARMLEAENVLAYWPIAKAVDYLDKMPIEEIACFLIQSGLAENPQKLRPLVEVSLSLSGGEEYSALIAALHPRQIKNIAAISPEIYSHDLCDALFPADYTDESKWDMLTAEQHQLIVDSKDLSQIRRLHNFNPDPETKKGRMNGPWGILKEDVVIRPEAVLAYFSAICNTCRSPAWKEASLRALGIDLLVYAMRYDYEIYYRCLREFPVLAEDLKARERSEDEIIYNDAADQHRQAQGRLQTELKSKGVVVSDKDLEGLLKDLRGIGISKNVTAEDVVLAVELRKDDSDLEKMLKNGLDIPDSPD